MPWGYVAGAVVSGVASYASSRNNKPSVEQTPSMTPEQQAQLNRVIETLFGRSSTTRPLGVRTATGFSDGQQMSLSALEEGSMGMARNNEALRAKLMGIADAPGASDAEVDSYFGSSIEDPAIKSFKERILPEITGRFKGNAAFGSDRIAAEGKAADDLTSSLAGQRAKLKFDTRESAKNRALVATGQIPQLDNNMMAALGQIFAGHTVGQQTNQGALDREYQEAVRLQGGETENMRLILQALGMGSPNTVVNPGSNNGLALGLGNAAGNYSQLALLKWLQNNNNSGSSGSGNINWNTESGLG